MLNETHDPQLTSWVASAQAPGHDFPLQNLPHGVFRRRGSAEAWRGGVAIGDEVLDMAAAQATACSAAWPMQPPKPPGQPALNALMALGAPAWRALRLALSRALRDGAPQAAQLRACLLPRAEVEHALPARVGDYTDFFTSWHHMVNVGRSLQPPAPPVPAFKHLPIAYHGRASTLEVSGAPAWRPRGLYRLPDHDTPQFGPTRKLDYELELGAWVGPGNARGQPIPLADAEQHLFGVCLLNDWSARDVQGFESLPLGPFLAKNFLTTVSPWIVTMEALAPFRCALPRQSGDPQEPLHLRHADATNAGIDIRIEAWLTTSASPGCATRLSHSSFRHGHWSLAQMLAHHTEGGCAMNPGDLLGSGTQSGPGADEQGCLMELSHGGRLPLTLASGEQRHFLEDGDTLTLRAWCERAEAVRIGFGTCTGQVRPPWG